MVIGFVLFLLVVVGVIIRDLGWQPQFSQTKLVHPSQPPVEILKTRYMDREITRDEYEHLRRDL